MGQTDRLPSSPQKKIEKKKNAGQREKKIIPDLVPQNPLMRDMLNEPRTASFWRSFAKLITHIDRAWS